MRILAQRTDIIDRITDSSTSSKLRCTNIDGIGTMINGSDAALQVLGRG